MLTDHIKQRLVIIILLLSLVLFGGFVMKCFSQNVSDSANAGSLHDKMEFMAENSESESGLAEFVSRMDEIREQRLDINGSGIDDLLQLHLLNEEQMKNLREYIQQYGALQSVFELRTVDGFDSLTIARILPFIHTNLSPEGRFFPVKQIIHGLHGSFWLRYQRQIEKAKGYYPKNDSTAPVYEGSPDKIFIRVDLHSLEKIKIALVGEKDAGEEFFRGQQSKGFDLYSGYVQLKDIGMLKNLVVGSYNVSYGQGLTMATTSGYYDPSDIFSIKSNGRGVVPSSSASMANNLCGSGASMRRGPVELSVFYSNHRKDANVEGERVTAFQETGYHRTTQEIADMKSVREVFYGGHLGFRKDLFRLGITAGNYQLDKELQPDFQLYNIFNFRGRTNQVYGFDFEFLLRRSQYFGEISMSKNGGKALICGALLHPNPVIDVAFLYRNYSPHFQNLTGAAFGRNSLNANEEGFYSGIKLTLFPSFTVTATYDIYRFPWLKYRINKPSEGSDLNVMIAYPFNGCREFYIRYRNNKATLNDAEESMISFPEGTRKQSLRLHMAYDVSPTIVFRERIEALSYIKPGYSHNQYGYLAFHDIQYHCPLLPVDLVFRFALFSADSYDERMYAYENDLLYCYSVPAFYDQGFRTYLLLKTRITRWLDVWGRIALTSYSGLQSMGTGNDEVEGNHKTEVKVQVRMSF